LAAKGLCIVKFLTVYEPERMSFRVYLRLTDEPNEQGAFLYRSGHDPKLYDAPEVAEVRPGEEPPLYMRIEEGLVSALAEALAPRPEFGERQLDDAIEVRDRLLTLIEANAILSDGARVAHIEAEAKQRRARR
jgi:hypothetical protein